MGNTEASLNTSRDILADLGGRLATLERQIEQNRVDLGEAKNLSRVAREVANNVENVRKKGYIPLIPKPLQQSIVCAARVELTNCQILCVVIPNYS